MGADLSSNDNVTRFDDVGSVSCNGNYVRWHITQFFNFPQSPNTLICSQNWLLGNRWYQLRVSPCGREFEDTSGWLGLYLVDVSHPSAGTDDQTFRITLGILGADLRELRGRVAERNRKWYRADKFMHRGEFKQKTHQFVENGTLRIFCKIGENRRSGSRQRADNRGRSKVEHRSNDIPHNYLPTSNNPCRSSSPLVDYWSSDMPQDYLATSNNPWGKPSQSYSSSDLLGSLEEATGTGIKYTFTEKNVKFTDEAEKKEDNYCGKQCSSTNPFPLPKDVIEKKVPEEDKNCEKQRSSTPLPKGAKESKKEKSDQDASEDNKYCGLQYSSTNKGIEKLLQDFKKLMLSGADSDITIKVEEKEFKAHRGILGARSPVFGAMMEHNMQEKASGIVTVKDMDAAIFQDFLSYLYTGRIDSMSSNKAPLLFTVADRYQVRELRDECVEYMKRNLLVDNFSDIYLLSLQHQEKELSDAAIQFFMRNITNILPTTKWQTFLSENSEEANDLIMQKMKDTSCP